MPNIRSITLAGVSAAVLAAVALVPLSGWNPIAIEPASSSTVVEPEAVTRNILCSGSVLAADGDSTTWSLVGKTSRAIDGGHEIGQFATEGDPDGAIVTYDSTPDAVAATEYASVNTDIIAGYMAAECGDPVNSQWLVGGNTTTGRDAVLTMSNASTVDARVDLEFWGANGPINAPAASGLVIPAGTSTSYSLAGFAPDEESPIIHVMSNGAPVWATLQVSVIRGLVPGGLDRVAPVGSPATNLVIPVVRQPDEKVIGPLLSDPDFADMITIVRVLNPGQQDGAATLTVTPFDGSDPVVIDIDVVAGKVSDIAIDDVAVGNFSIAVDADVPVVAAARFSAFAPSTSIADIAWAPAIAPRLGPAMAFVPTGDSLLTLINPGETAATVEVTVDGETVTLAIDARSTDTLVVPRGPVTVTSDSAIVAGVVIETSKGIATLRLPTEPLGARSVTVISH